MFWLAEIIKSLGDNLKVITYYSYNGTDDVDGFQIDVTYL